MPTLRELKDRLHGASPATKRRFNLLARRYLQQNVQLSGGVASSITNNNTLHIVTFNVFEHTCQKIDSDFLDIDQDLDQGIDVVVFTQEDSSKERNIITDRYKRIKMVHRLVSGSESLACYSNSSDLEILPDWTSPSYKHLKGRGVLTLRWQNRLILCNLHLEGGRYSDSMLCFKDQDFEELVQQKLRPLVHAINMMADVVVGDFNSVMAENPNVRTRMIENQKQYFKQVPCKGSEFPKDLDSRIERWNTTPHQTLMKAGYAYSAARNEADSFTNFRGKSIVDHIYYRHKNIKVIHEKSTILDKHGIDYQNDFDCKGSDHNPVAFKVAFMPVAQAKLVEEEEEMPTAKASMVKEEEMPKRVEEEEMPTAKANMVQEEEMPTAQAKLVEVEEMPNRTMKAEMTVTLTDNTPLPIRLLNDFEKTFCTVL